MNGLFINYRREDTAPYAGRLYDYLRHHFPKNKVFMDVDAIDPGEDFVKAINQTLSVSKIVIAVIGPQWDKVTDKDGLRRLDNPDDHVVRELVAAIDSDTKIIPVLVGGATMPRTDALPVRLQLLTRRNAIEISDSRFTSDAERLASVIEKVLNSSANNLENVLEEKSEIKRTDVVTSDSMTTFKVLLWTSYALGVLISFIQLGRTEDVRGTLLQISCSLA